MIEKSLAEKIDKATARICNALIKKNSLLISFKNEILTPDDMVTLIKETVSDFKNNTTISDIEMQTYLPYFKEFLNIVAKSYRQKSHDPSLVFQFNKEIDDLLCSLS